LRASIKRMLRREPLVIGNDCKMIRRVAWCTGAAQDLVRRLAWAWIHSLREKFERMVHAARESSVAFISADITLRTLWCTGSGRYISEIRNRSGCRYRRPGMRRTVFQA
jgi:hypothetical protein